MTQPLTAYPWPLTFGVEWEFGVPYLKDETIPLPHLDDASKILRFTRIDSDYDGKSVYEEKADFFPARNQVCYQTIYPEYDQGSRLSCWCYRE
jgi:hypothetical protein